VGVGATRGARGPRRPDVDDGATIVETARDGRGWIPTGLPAVPLPATIVAEGREPRAVTLPDGPVRICSGP